MSIQLKRAYDKPSPRDGFRVLVDRIWPRGVSKNQLGVDEWLKDLSPSPTLRKWFAHDPKKYEQFKKRYGRELQSHRNQVQWLRHKAAEGPLTLVYAAKDEQHNNATVLKEVLEKR